MHNVSVKIEIYYGQAVSQLRFKLKISHKRMKKDGRIQKGLTYEPRGSKRAAFCPKNPFRLFSMILALNADYFTT